MVNVYVTMELHQTHQNALVSLPPATLHLTFSSTHVLKVAHALQNRLHELRGIKLFEARVVSITDKPGPESTDLSKCDRATQILIGWLLKEYI